MAAKKIKTKSAPSKGGAKPAAKSSKPAPAAKKPAVKAGKKATPVKKPAPAAKKPVVKTGKKPAPVKKSAPVKKPAPVEKAAPAKKPVPTSVATPAKKAPSLKKAASERSAKKIIAPVKSVEKVPDSKPTAAPSKVSPLQKPVAAPPVKEEISQKAVPIAKKVPAVKPRSSVVDFPAPPAPIKPPFVPPKAAPSLAGEPVAAGSNGTHSPAFVQKQRQRLLDLRDDLVDAVSGMARDTIRNAPEGSEASGSGQHQGDAGSDAYDRDFALSVLAKEQDALYEIEQALRRIQSGSYGICEMSARKIPQARLEAIPFARLTVECQGQWEKEYGNRRFRPSNEVGFSGGKYVDDEETETVSLDEDDD